MPVSVQSLAVAVTVLLLADVVAGAEASDVASAARSITASELKRHVDILADDTFEGRDAGSRGGRAAGNYLLKAFEGYGLKPAGDQGTFFQSFNGQSRNLLGLLEGSDPALSREVIIVGAHYDHVGYGRPTNSFGPFGYVHNGADDNASGISGLLEVIDAFKRLPAAPKRSILFVLWDAEEQGLLGSKYWLAHPTVPLDRVMLKINMDMIGRLTNERVEVFGGRTTTNLRQIISRCNAEQPLTLDFNWKMKADSDHYPFYERGIPTLMFHTGLHKDYHRPSDDTHLINNEGIERVARLCFLTVEQLADAPDRKKFRAASRQENVMTQARLEAPTPTQPARFGIGWKKQVEDGPLMVTHIVAGAPAAKSGIQVGDKLLSFNGEPVEDQDRFHLQLLAASGPTTFNVERRGESATREIVIEPAGSPVRVGLTWRVDDAEPHAVIVTQVLGGSATEQAGIRLKDRIYAVNDQPITSSDHFAEMIRTPGVLKLLIERNGQLQTVELHKLDPQPTP